MNNEDLKDIEYTVMIYQDCPYLVPIDRLKDIEIFYQPYLYADLFGKEKIDEPFPNYCINLFDYEVNLKISSIKKN